MSTVRIPGTIEEAKELVDGGYDLNTRDQDGCTALMRIAAVPEACNMELIAFLVKHGANINAVDNDGRTALSLAVYWNNFVCFLSDLVDLGADASIADCDSLAPIHHAVLRGSPMLLEDLLGIPQVDVDFPTAEGITALMYAAAKNNVAMVRLLLDRGADVRRTTDDGATALTCAAMMGANGAIAELLQAGASVNAEDARGRTPLSVACEEGFLSTAKLLLEMGADPNAGEPRPLAVATEHGDDELAALLRTPHAAQ